MAEQTVYCGRRWIEGEWFEFIFTARDWDDAKRFCQHAGCVFEGKTEKTYRLVSGGARGAT